MNAKPPAEFHIDARLVRTLIAEQHADLASLPIVDAGEGWDNRLFRLGDNLIVRLPRRALSAALIEHEQRWLPDLSPQLPLPVPVPLRTGRAGCGFPWSWSITRWFPGRSALHAPPQDDVLAAATLGAFLRALHVPAPREAPGSVWRGVPLGNRTASLHGHVEQLAGSIDRARVLALWERALATPPWPGPPLWIHGDCHPGNLIVADGRLSAVVDFGDLTSGDPATDLSVAWMFLSASVRAVFRDAARGPFDVVNDDTWMRARGWALALGLAYVANSQDDEALRDLGFATIDAALAGEE